MRILSAHGKPITCLAWSRDGTRLAEAAFAGDVRVWDVASGTVTHHLTEPGRHPNQVKLAFSPDGRWLAVANGPVQLLELATGAREELPVEFLRTGAFNGIEFSPEGDQLLGAGEYWNWWKLETKARLARAGVPRVRGASGIAWRCAAFSADGTRVAACRSSSVAGPSVNHVFVFDRAATQLLGSYEWKGQDARRVLFAPDGRTVVAVAGTVLRAWDVGSGKSVAAIKGDSKKHFMGAVFTPDGRYVITVSTDETTRLWDARTWSAGPSYDWEIGQLLDVAVWPGGQAVAVASHKGKILLFDVD
jgi:WD40 repeat protein